VQKKQRCIIAIVDDDEAVREATKSLLRSVGFAVETFPSGEDFLRWPDLNRTACLVADFNMPGMTGLELHFQVTALDENIPTILITAYPSENNRTRALDAGVLNYLVKPFSETEIVGSVRSALNEECDARGGM
jgi:FixJ family two-component response regulator